MVHEVVVVGETGVLEEKMDQGERQKKRGNKVCAAASGRIKERVLSN